MNSSLYSEIEKTDFVIDYLQAHHYIEGFYVFEGDKHGDFSGDIIVVLSDGSAWKGHPTQSEELSQWESGDKIHIGLRTSFYWFKREHKFFLYNYTTKETVKVMLIKYGEDPLEITFASKPYPTDWRLVPIRGSDGEIISYYREPCRYRKDVLLNNSIEWTVSENLKSFKVGKKVHYGFNHSGINVDFFLITGKEREAVWSWIEHSDSE